MATNIKKVGTIWLFLLLSLAATVFAVHDSTVNLFGYTTTYETRTSNLIINIYNNYSSTDSINNVLITTPGFTLINIIDPTGWTHTENPLNYITSTSGISNDFSGNFRFNAKAEKVTADTIYTWDVNTTSSNTVTHSFNLIVLNDPTAPIIYEVYPNQTYIQGLNQSFWINTTDDETGIANASLWYGDCINYSEYILNCTNNICESTIDLYSLPDSSILCYYFTAYNNAGDLSQSENLTTVIDRTPPTVIANSPTDNIFIRDLPVVFVFKATDNVAPTLECSLIFNGITEETKTVSNGVEDNFTLDTLADGTYNWSVSCRDIAGWTNQSELRTFTIDTMPPLTNIQIEPRYYRGINIPISADITDLGSGVNESTVYATITTPSGITENLTLTKSGSVYSAVYATTYDSELGDYTVTYHSADNLGNAGNESATFRLFYNYIINLNLNPPTTNISNSSANITNYVDVIGNVLFDNGSLIPETNITLIYPDLAGIYTSISLLIDNSTGNFNYTLTSPETAGIYNVNSSVYCIDNNETYSASKTLRVNGLPYCGDGILNGNEECDGSDLDGKTCRSLGFSSGTLSCSATCEFDTSLCTRRSSGGGSGGSSGGGSSGVPITIPITVPQPVEQPEEKPVTTPKPVVQPTPEPIMQEITVPEPEQKKVTEPVGVGKAFSIFDVIGKINWLSILILTGLITLLFFISTRKKKAKKNVKKDVIGLDAYLAKRSQWR